MGTNQKETKSIVWGPWRVTPTEDAMVGKLAIADDRQGKSDTICRVIRMVAAGELVPKTATSLMIEEENGKPRSQEQYEKDQRDYKDAIDKIDKDESGERKQG